MQIFSFSASYLRTIYNAISGRRDTRYPLGIIWRWKHRRYRDL